MCHLLTAIPVPELGIVAFKPGINQLHHFSGRMIVMSAPDELSDAKAGRIAEQAVLNLVIDANPPASLMKIPKLKRWGNQKYLQWVKLRPCCLCQKPADDAHHLIGYGYGGIGVKAHDLFSIPLCRGHHSELHHDPKAWEVKYGSQLALLFGFLDESLGLGALS
ncbi:MAG TPA: DUF968 domain-containing protein [Arsenophonus nasoniae]|uniref:DUF968 domain-containing protein n=1 Tax=Arsenophonus nasoniae TaxID=638 RepID=UPI003879BBFE